MNGNFLDTERSSREIILFGFVALGLLVGLIGLIISSVLAALAGLLFVWTGLGGFLLRHWLEK